MSEVSSRLDVVPVDGAASLCQPRRLRLFDRPGEKSFVKNKTKYKSCISVGYVFTVDTHM